MVRGLAALHAVSHAARGVQATQLSLGCLVPAVRAPAPAMAWALVATTMPVPFAQLAQPKALVALQSWHSWRSLVCFWLR